MSVFWRKYLRAIAVALAALTLLCAVSCQSGADAPESEETTPAKGGESLESTSESLDGEPDEDSSKESSVVTESNSEKATEGKTESETESCEPEIEAEFEICDGEARVTTASGLYYVATGFKTVDSGFVFSDGLEITFPEGVFSEEFNRMQFGYRASAPVKLHVTYTADGEEITDYFFLEAGSGTFRGLIGSYLDGKRGVGIKRLTVDTCEDVEASFMLLSLSTETIPLYEDDLCVENGRYKIGVRLSWGGAMTYFEDKLDGDDALGNLVNIHDTGRLIQQSFYGTYSNGEYVSGVYNGNQWPYNPVQGGNKFQSGRPRLIDVEVGEDYVYIKAQSLDWALDNVLTFVYYDNKYTLKDDHVVVDNVATDFSGWVHGAGGQEIPAVYIVSYFDTLAFYNGTKPWTGDEEGVCYERELGDWSNSGSFPLYKGNTETWSIWINTADSFGFGIYCPNIQKHIAIRNQYDGSKDPMSNSCSYVAPSCSIVMQSYKPIVYSYILATGEPQEIRDIFTENKDFADNASLSENRYDILVSPEKFDMTDIDLTVEENMGVFHSPKNLRIDYDGEEQALKLTIDNGHDPYVTLGYGTNSDRKITNEDFNAIEIEYMLPVTNSQSADSLVLFISSEGSKNYKDRNTSSGTVVRDGEYHTLVLKAPSSMCQGELLGIRFDPFSRSETGDVMYIRRITLKTYRELDIENDLTVDGSEKVFSSMSRTQTVFDMDQGAVALSVLGGSDVNVTFDFSRFKLHAGEYTQLVVEYMVPVTNTFTSNSATVYFKTEGSGSFAESRTVSNKLTVDGEYHTMVFDFSGKEGWTGLITSLRFDYFQSGCKDGDVIYIRRVDLIKDPDGEAIDISGESGAYFAQASRTKVEKDEKEDALRLEVSGGSDVYVVMDISDKELDAADYSKLYIRYMIPVSNSQKSYSYTLYFTTDAGGSYSESQAVYGKLIIDGEYHTLEIDLSQKTSWTGIIQKLRFDYFQSNNSDGDLFYIKTVVIN